MVLMMWSSIFLSCLLTTTFANPISQLLNDPNDLETDSSEEILASNSENLINPAQTFSASQTPSDNLIPSNFAISDGSSDSPPDFLLTPSNAQFSSGLSGQDDSNDVAFLPTRGDVDDTGMEGGTGTETGTDGGSFEGAPSGNSGGSSPGTGSSGGVNPGGINVPPLIPSGENTPGSSSTAPNEGPDAGLNLPEPPPNETPRQRTARKAKECAEFDKGFNCEKWSRPGIKMHRFCCKGRHPVGGTWNGLYSNDAGLDNLIVMDAEFISLQECCIGYDPRKAVCLAAENRICAVCKDKDTLIAYNAFNPFYRYISPTRKFPKTYEPSPPLREISEEELNEPGREVFIDPQGSPKAGDRRNKASLCTNEYLAWHPYRPYKWVDEKPQVSCVPSQEDEWDKYFDDPVPGEHH